jgi:hypothetical protein
MKRPFPVTLIGWCHVFAGMAGVFLFLKGLEPHFGENSLALQHVGHVWIANKDLPWFAPSNFKHILVCLFAGATFLSCFFIGFGLLRGKNWARYLLFAVAFFNFAYSKPLLGTNPSGLSVFVFIIVSMYLFNIEVGRFFYQNEKRQRLIGRRAEREGM